MGSDSKKVIKNTFLIKGSPKVEWGCSTSIPYSNGLLSVLFPDDGALSTLWLTLGACGLWVPLLLSESAAAPPSVWVSAPGAKGHIHSWKTQVGPFSGTIHNKTYGSVPWDSASDGSIKKGGCTAHPSSCVLCNSAVGRYYVQTLGMFLSWSYKKCGWSRPTFLNKCGASLVWFREQAREIFWGQYDAWSCAGASLFVLQEKASGSQKARPH